MLNGGSTYTSWKKPSGSRGSTSALSPSTTRSGPPAGSANGSAGSSASGSVMGDILSAHRHPGVLRWGVAIDYAGSARPTLGVEWEFALVDRSTRDLSNTASELFDRVRDSIGEQPNLHKELLRNTVEVVTGVCDTTAGAMADLTDTLRLVTPVARELGVDLYSAGTHPFAEWSTQLLTPGDRYEELIARTQWWGRQMLIWGVHVHVGVADRDHVMPIVSSLLNHFPHLQALSASSPMWSGTDTGYASNRAMMFQQLPTAGLPFQFETWEEYEGFVAANLRTGVIDYLSDIRWDVRPSPRSAPSRCGSATGSPTSASSPPSPR